MPLGDCGNLGGDTAGTENWISNSESIKETLGGTERWSFKRTGLSQVQTNSMHLKKKNYKIKLKYSWEWLGFLSSRGCDESSEATEL